MASADQLRQQREQALYLAVLQGDQNAARTLYQNATGADGDNNPAATRNYAKGFIAQLNQQGIQVSDQGITAFGTATTSMTGTGQVGTQAVAQQAQDPVTAVASSISSALGLSPSATASAVATPTTTGASTATPGIALGQGSTAMWVVGGALFLTVLGAFVLGSSHRRG